MAKDKHKQIDICGQLSVHTRDILYVKRCKPYGNEELSKSQLMIKIKDSDYIKGDNIYLPLGTELAKLFYEQINEILEGVEVLTVEDIRKIM